ncbi:SAM-dependent methyltransferase [Rhodobacteraceae bacterium WD3A24]|nr:SAM-dependent methyltransferase [Rhodobacteraceae bacterium WD3A24]
MIEHALYYTDALIENLQLRWGSGFLSPGGADELARMLGDIDLRGAHVLDLGCGIGGYDALLAEAHGAAHVVGVDIDAASLERARAMAHDRGLTSNLTFLHVAPGPLPFADGQFDAVISKDSLVDLPDKPAALAELFRVARPGAALAVSDWFRAEAPYTPEMRAWATEGGETYDMATLAGTARELATAGFTDIETEDRNVWFRSYARDEYERLKGPLYQTYVARFGEAQAARSVENARIRALLAAQGQLRPGHLRARRP